ncbi:MAG TPA: DUF1761 domain-containing protein [Candidatus Limnocylindria bacterium]|nr:DUF1761 domain-containing protein [Candidatus Limnocylindria bacterium]
MNFGVNYIAVVVAAVVALVIGFIWYSPRVFGTRWMAYLGTTQAQLGNPGPTGMAVGVVASLINAWVLAVLSLNLGGKTLTDGIMLGVLAWLGFMATITAAQISFEKKPWGLWVLNNAHNLLVQVIMGAIVTAWR